MRERESEIMVKDSFQNSYLISCTDGLCPTDCK